MSHSEKNNGLHLKSQECPAESRRYHMFLKAYWSAQSGIKFSVLAQNKGNVKHLTTWHFWGQAGRPKTGNRKTFI
jgi:hypothetical protein